MMHAASCTSYNLEIVYFFFFSSRRLHTRCLSDWSSDVCSSDLINFASAPQNVTLSNAGTGPLSISSVAISGTNAAYFTDVSGCGISLPAGGNCNIAVTFKPTATGIASAALTPIDKGKTP